MKTEYKKFPCGLCGSKNFSRLFTITDSSPFLSQPLQVNISKCKDCGLITSNPRIKDIYAMYNSGYYEHEVCQSDMRIEVSRLNVAGKAFSRIEKIINKKSGSLIDIGCGSGFFLNGLIKGGCNWRLSGLDITNCLQGEAKKKAIFFESSIEHANKIKERFDLAVMIEVAEHLENPLKSFNAVNKMLDKDGWLFISTGNMESIISKIRGKKESYYRAPHISYWSPKTISTCLEKCGFEVRKITTLYNGNWQHFKDTKNVSFLAKAVGLEALNRIHIGNTYLVGGMNVFARKK